MIRLHVEAGEPPLVQLENVVYPSGLRTLFDAEGRRLELSKPTYMEPGSPRWSNRELKLAQVEARAMPERIRLPANLPRISEPGSM